MNDSGRALRKGVFTALDEAVTYGANAVPVFDQKVETVVLNKPYILIANTSDADKSSKQKFVVETNLDIEIYQLRKSTAKSEVLDNISDQILQIILPAPGIAGFTMDTPFHVTNCKLVSGNLNGLTEIRPGEFLHGKRITIKNRITQ